MRFSYIALLLISFVLALIDAAAVENVEKITRAEKAVIQKRAQSFSGKATWFVPSKEGGSQGACGPNEADDAHIVALNHPQYGSLSGKSSWCGKKILITYGKKSVTATINDACPECAHGDLDLTPVLFAKLGNLNTGILKIKWHLI
ncbi:RlpA-like double-psi beta-barrel-protein domain-containing protein-containing protein [Phycomyces nitens]|nr:RlpA-like double-psi beta-barrel-protein domain-containing protein-containing protein [Phycomyces nitens]